MQIIPTRSPDLAESHRKCIPRLTEMSGGRSEREEYNTRNMGRICFQGEAKYLVYANRLY